MAPKSTPAAAARRKRKAKSESESSSSSDDDDNDATAAGGASGGGAKRRVELRVNPSRVRLLSEEKNKPATGGPVILWMSRDQRLDDNWALLFAAQLAAAGGVNTAASSSSSPPAPAVPLAVAFNLVPAFLGAGARQFGFMLRGLKELEARLSEISQKKVAFFLLEGEPTETLPALAAETGARAVVSDFSPLRLNRAWKRGVAERLPASCSLFEVDAHNVVPCWAATDKKEVGARTLRPKIHRLLPEFLTEFPQAGAALSALPAWSGAASLKQPTRPDWDAAIGRALAAGAAVPEVLWLTPGAAAASAALAAFLEPSRLKKYATKRNDPNDPSAQSSLSPYLHFGQLGAQRAALEAAKHRGSSSTRESVEAFLEELVVRKELSDNFCHFEPDAYDSLDGAAPWARESLELHASDPREFTYSREQLENAQTHDELWNASQRQLVHLGKMHGYMRMYWCKKILEWSARPSEALATVRRGRKRGRKKGRVSFFFFLSPHDRGVEIIAHSFLSFLSLFFSPLSNNNTDFTKKQAIYLNDRYELDGRDPSGYVGCMWSICGTHDMG